MTIILSLALLLVSTLITRQLVVNSHRFSKMDIPNERSSHLTPTPRGGGIAFVATSLVGLFILLLNNTLNNEDLLALGCAGAIVAVAGFLDDRQKISGAMIRLVLHGIGAISLVVGIEFPSQISLFDQTISTGLIGSILSVLYLVWLLNLFNFMDGTDGIAASEAIFVVLAGAFLNYHVLSDANHSAAAVVLAASTFGFILYNWSPAKIFMGDTGSLALGGALAGIATMLRIELLLIPLGGLFVIITMSVIIQTVYFKLSGGKRVFKMAPLQHHFELMGWGEVTIVLRFWIIAGLCVALGLGLFYTQWVAG